MGYAPDNLGDFATEVTDALTNLRTTAADIQTGANVLAQKLTQAGNIAVRVSNTATGAAAGAKVGAESGSRVPVDNPLKLVPTPVWVAAGIVALLAIRGTR
jgi:hypothetical protein